MTDDIVRAVRRLVPQLSASAMPPSRADLLRLVTSDNTVLFVAKEKRGRAARVVGMLALAFYRTPTARRAWIEDVVVDARSRGRGIGEALCRVAIRRAAALGADTIDLTSRPERGASNRLYPRLGFVRRDTNVYRYPLKPR